MCNAEALFLVDYDKPQVLELDIFLDYTVGAYYDIYAACFQPAQYFALFSRGLVP